MENLIKWYERLARRRESEIYGKSGNGPEGRHHYTNEGIYTPGGRVGKDGDVMIAGGFVSAIVGIFCARLINPDFFEKVGGVTEGTTVVINGDGPPRLKQSKLNPPANEDHYSN